VTDQPEFPARRHRWGEPVNIEPDQSPLGGQETHRKCVHGCGIIKITVHPPAPELPYRLWQYSDGERADGLTPMCGQVSP
jgi:hypothetical protein